MAWQFHSSCHGSNISVRPLGSCALRNPDSFDNGITFSNRPIQLGEKVSLFFKKNSNRWTGSPRVGFTNQNPDQINPQSLPPVYAQEASYQSQTWVVPLMQTRGSSPCESIFVDVIFDQVGVITLRQFGHPEKLLDTRGTVDFNKPVWLTVDLCGSYGYVINRGPCIPEEIANLRPSAPQEYLKALTKGSRSVCHCGLRFIGQEGVGKTSLVKMLTGQRFDPMETLAQRVSSQGTVFRQVHKEEGAGESHATVDGDIVLDFWDFPGRDLDNTIFQVPLRHQAVLVLVFNLSQDLDEPAIIEVLGPDGKRVRQQHELTRWECIDFWLRTVFVSVSITQQSQAGQQSFPPVIIVGTHRNSVGRDMAERMTLVDAKFTSIRERLTEAPYKQYVVSRFFAVENTPGDPSDAEVAALKSMIWNISCSGPYVEEEIPLKWLKFDETRRSSPPILSLLMVQQLIGNSVGDMTDAEVKIMLQLYSYMGQIICWRSESIFPDQPLTAVLIMDPLWLINALSKVTAAWEPQAQFPALVKAWRRLTEHGVLEERLVDHLWGDILHKAKDWSIRSKLDIKQTLLSIMHKLELLCERRPVDQVPGTAGDQMETSERQGTSERTYFVPSSLHKRHVSSMEPHNPASSNVFYVDFMGCLPDSIFSRLVVRTLVWSQDQEGIEQEPRLAHRYVRFSVDADHEVEMKMSPLKSAYIKVCVIKLAVVSTSARASSKPRKLQSAPSPSVTNKVRDFISAALDSVKSKWAKGLKFRFCVPCPCDPEGTLHFLSLQECLEKERVRCPRELGVRIDTSWIKEMFCDSVATMTQNVDPYLMSEKHLREIVHELGPEWERLAGELGFNRSRIFKFKQDNSTVDNAIFSMLVTWSKNEGGHTQRKAQQLSEALVTCECSDVVTKLLDPYM